MTYRRFQLLLEVRHEPLRNNHRDLGEAERWGEGAFDVFAVFDLQRVHDAVVVGPDGVVGRDALDLRKPHRDQKVPPCLRNVDKVPSVRRNHARVNGVEGQIKRSHVADVEGLNPDGGGDRRGVMSGYSCSLALKDRVEDLGPEGHPILLEVVYLVSEGVESSLCVVGAALSLVAPVVTCVLGLFVELIDDSKVGDGDVACHRG